MKNFEMQKSRYSELGVYRLVTDKVDILCEVGYMGALDALYPMWQPSPTYLGLRDLLSERLVNLGGYNFANPADGDLFTGPELCFSVAEFLETGTRSALGFIHNVHDRYFTFTEDMIVVIPTTMPHVTLDIRCARASHYEFPGARADDEYVFLQGSSVPLNWRVFTRILCRCLGGSRIGKRIIVPGDDGCWPDSFRESHGIALGRSHIESYNYRNELLARA
ncbi:hypothetical protein TWF730_007101 [Orbilia blumenaviensis]|uniref:Uncharacterized protein n=1 Tax=Orbilia blumenaviensis TaxID=1796055 RepID=A0AAV9VIJ1_9PEZI